ncbi:MAG TPA: DUF4132 domain-containing protein [Armatimonadota bacterium]|jgi:hypothetical protein
MPDNTIVPAISLSPDPTDAALRTLLVSACALLGPQTPLPALFEEVMRAWRGLPVQTKRLQGLQSLLIEVQQDHGWADRLTDLLRDTQEKWEVRVLSAILLAQARHPLGHPPALSDDTTHTLYAFARFTAPDATDWYLRELTQALASIDAPDPLRLPTPRILLAFLKGLAADALPERLFVRCVLLAGVLHPHVASGRPWRHLHRLLDYLGLSEDPLIRQAYRQLVADIWPGATAHNWAQWFWITAPGGPDIFPSALRAVADGEVTLPRVHELRFALLPDPAQLTHLLTQTPPAVILLLSWLRPECLRHSVCPLPGGEEALRWLAKSNHAAAAIAYTAPPWWPVWCQHGLPLAREVLGWLQAMALPDVPAQDRHDWLTQHVLPAYRALCANLLCVQAASGERVEELLTLAREQDLPAIRALALAPNPTDAVLHVLHQLYRVGGRPVQAAAHGALDHIAHRQGLPGAAELERQHLLTAAWELGPLAGERVRVGWQIGAYRMRLSLQGGKALLETLGPHGAVAHVPDAVRQSEAYRQARGAQREAQQQYRTFKQHLERQLIEASPMTSGEFHYLLANPIFAHLAERLVWQLGDGATLLWAGPDRWMTAQGEAIAPFFPADRSTLSITLAHPITLARARQLVTWQTRAADQCLMQPLKQLFREIYTAEGEAGVASDRFAGRTLDTSRAYALLRAAGFAPGAGVARREWPGGITAHLCWAEGVVSHDLFGPQRQSSVTTGGIWFTHAGVRCSLAEVDPIIFSETLRAADLLTTRAAVGDADLTSRETVAMRALLLREVTRSFNLTNIAVREEGRYALVLGTHATYRVNLSSGTVLLEPEGRQILLPQRDARWHPVEGEDATSAILAIVLELAQDDQINDLTFLAQIAP